MSAWNLCLRLFCFPILGGFSRVIQYFPPSKQPWCVPYRKGCSVTPGSILLSMSSPRYHIYVLLTHSASMLRQHCTAFILTTLPFRQKNTWLISAAAGTWRVVCSLILLNPSTKRTVFFREIYILNISFDPVIMYLKVYPTSLIPYFCEVHTTTVKVCPTTFLPYFCEGVPYQFSTVLLWLINSDAHDRKKSHDVTTVRSRRYRQYPQTRPPSHRLSGHQRQAFVPHTECVILETHSFLLHVLSPLGVDYNHSRAFLSIALVPMIFPPPTLIPYLPSSMAIRDRPPKSHAYRSSWCACVYSRQTMTPLDTRAIFF